MAAELAQESEVVMMEMPDGTKAKIKKVTLPPSLQS